MRERVQKRATKILSQQCQVSTDATQTTIQSHQVDKNDEIITDLSRLSDESSADFPTPLEAVDRSELIRL